MQLLIKGVEFFLTHSFRYKQNFTGHDMTKGVFGVNTNSKVLKQHAETHSNLSGLNTDGSFTMDNSNSFLSPYEILPKAQENKCLGKFSYLIME